MFKFHACLTAGFALSIATPAAAAPIEYTLTGLFTQTGTTGEIAATITALGDTSEAFADIIDGETTRIVPLSGISLTVGGQTSQIAGPALFFTLPGFGFSGFSPIEDVLDGLIFESAGLIGYDGVSAVGPTDVTVAVAQLTIGGRLVAFTARDARFSAAAVPEPASWAMMIAGFGLAGAALRRGRRVAVPA